MTATMSVSESDVESKPAARPVQNQARQKATHPAKFYVHANLIPEERLESDGTVGHARGVCRRVGPFQSELEKDHFLKFFRAEVLSAQERFPDKKDIFHWTDFSAKLQHQNFTACIARIGSGRQLGIRFIVNGFGEARVLPPHAFIEWLRKAGWLALARDPALATPECEAENALVDAKLQKLGHEPENSFCSHALYRSQSHGNHCLCGTVMYDSGM